jgi:hypothetical protein
LDAAEAGGMIVAQWFSQVWERMLSYYGIDALYKDTDNRFVLSGFFLLSVLVIAVYHAFNIEGVNIFIAFIAGLVIGFLWFFLSFGILLVYGVVGSFLISLHPKRPSRRPAGC